MIVTMDYQFLLPEGRGPWQEEPELSPRPQVWGGWATFGFGLLIFFITLIVQVILGFLIAFIYIMVQESAGVSLDSVNDLIDQFGGVITSISVIVNGVIGTGLIWLIIRAKRGLSFTEYLGFRKFRPRTLLLLLATFGLYYGFVVVMNIVTNQPGEGSSDLALYSVEVWPVLVWISFVIFAPLYEEIWIRGFLLEGFARSKIGAVGAIALTSLFWAVQHVQYSMFQVGMIFVFGIVLGIVRLRTKSLWAPISLHIINNLIAMIELTMLN